MSAERLAELVEALAGGVTFVLDEHTYRLADRPLAEWMAALMEGGPFAVVPAFLSDEDQEQLYDRLTDPWEPMDPDICQEIGYWAVEQLTGRPWWEVNRLIRLSLEMVNPFDGWCLERGIRLAELSLRSFCNATFRFALTCMDKDAREGWIELLQAPPTPEALETRPEWSEDAMADSFDAVFATKK